jgi:drug/metabolite transporter (DMT)-like permease
VLRGGGTWLCLVSAAAFGVAPLLAKLSYERGVGVVPMLAGRFALASLVLWLLAWRLGVARITARTALPGLALGLVVYSPQSGAYFASIERMDASMAALVVYVYPAIVAVAAAALGRERLSGRLAAALVVASGGVALVLLGSGGGDVDALGVVLALGAAAGYAAYFLVSDGAMRTVHPLTLAALLSSGAAAAFVGAGLLGGGLPIGIGPTAWGLVGALALVSTVLAIACLLAGIARVGPASAGVLSTLEPVVAAVAACAALGERLGPLQILGGLLVVAAVLVLRAGAGRARAGRASPPPAAAIEGVRSSAVESSLGA